MIFIYSIKQGFGNRKIGITNSPKQRLQSIRTTYPKAKWAVLLPTPFVAGHLERFFHRLFKFCRVTRKGSGKTEWFRVFVFGWLVDLFITVVVGLCWFGVWLILEWIVKVY
jgi:hypothetical protein